MTPRTTVLDAVSPAAAAGEVHRATEHRDTTSSDAPRRVSRWREATRATGWRLAGAAALAAGLVAAGRYVPVSAANGTPAPPLSALLGDGTTEADPIVVLLRLTAAALIGLSVTAVQRPKSRSMQQAQTLLCVAGAVTMIVIDNSLARAFGVAGAAAIIRFRTPVDDPRDITVLFLQMALGMAAGLGAFALAGIGTLFLATLLVVLDTLAAGRRRKLLVDLTATGPMFPAEHVRQVFERRAIPFEPREIWHGDPARVKYAASLDQADALEDLTRDLLGPGSGLRSVSWCKKTAS
jgi:hypothetical protein